MTGVIGYLSDAAVCICVSVVCSMFHYVLRKQHVQLLRTSAAIVTQLGISNINYWFVHITNQTHIKIQIKK